MKSWLIVSLATVGMFGAGVFTAPAAPRATASYDHKWPVAPDAATMVAVAQPALADGAVAALRGLRGSLPSADLVMVTEASLEAAGIRPLRCRADC